VRGVSDGRVDKMAAEGMRLNNFNVGTPHGLARRAHDGRTPFAPAATQRAGARWWEFTIAEALKQIGMPRHWVGKWHLGGDAPRKEGTVPYRLRRDSTGFPAPARKAQTTMRERLETPGKLLSGEASWFPEAHREKLSTWNRALVDARLERSHRFHGAKTSGSGSPFLYYPMTQIISDSHPSRLAGKTGAGD